MREPGRDLLDVAASAGHARAPAGPGDVGFLTTHYSLGPVGAAVLGWAAARYGATATFLLAGTSCLLLALAALPTPVRRRHPERA
ncbi:MAG TPA: hypothetical protein VFV66_35450 [Nonomuraea sp.]|nr:hypothetical protein [Nonomuraea sp.]